MNRWSRFAFLFIFASLTYSDTFPWGKSTLADCQEDLFDSCRTNMILELKRGVLEAVSVTGTDGKLIYPISALKNLDDKLFLSPTQMQSRTQFLEDTNYIQANGY